MRTDDAEGKGDFRGSIGRRNMQHGELEEKEPLHFMKYGFKQRIEA